MPVLNAVTTSDDYTSGATISDVWNGRGGWFSVTGAEVDVQLQYDLAGGKQGRGQAEWLEPMLLGDGAFAYIPPNAIGVRFKSHTSGLPATVTAQIAQGPEPGLQVVAVGSVTVTGLSLTFQHNELAAGSEPILDLDDAANVLTWTLTDDPANTRMKLTAAFPSSVIFPGSVASVHGSQAVGGDGTHSGWELDDTTLTGLFASVSVNASNVFLTSTVAGDATDYRFTIDAQGDLQWGPGSGARDVTLQRVSGAAPSNTGVGLRVTSALYATSTQGFVYQAAVNNQALGCYFSAADSQPVFKIFTQGAMVWGPGGTGALDIELARVVNVPTGTGSFLEFLNGDGFGYGTGTGGTATCATGGSCTINKPTGKVTATAAIATGSSGNYTVNNTVVGADDVIVVNVTVAGTLLPQTCTVCQVAAGKFTIVYTNNTGASQTPVFNFAVIKGAVA